MALTFDYGPSEFTRPIVRTLRRLRVPATLLPVGQMASAHPGIARLVRPVVSRGDHTLSHPPMARLPWRRQRFEVLEAAVRMHASGGRFPRLFRPPYGSFDSGTLRLVRRLRMLMVLWSVDSLDYERPGTHAIVSNVVSAVRPGAIVLMHDGGGPRGQTVGALPLIVRALRRCGYRFVTVPRMLPEAPPGSRQKLPAGVALQP